jgi:hypothetical protein
MYHNYILYFVYRPIFLIQRRKKVLDFEPTMHPIMQDKVRKKKKKLLRMLNNNNRRDSGTLKSWS